MSASMAFPPASSSLPVSLGTSGSIGSTSVIIEEEGGGSDDGRSGIHDGGGGIEDDGPSSSVSSSCSGPSGRWSASRASCNIVGGGADSRYPNSSTTPLLVPSPPHACPVPGPSGSEGSSWEEPCMNWR